MATWDKITSRGSVDDRRSSRGVLLGGGGLGVGGLVVVLLINYFTGIDLTNVATEINNQASYQESGEFAGADAYEVFASTILGSNNEAWAAHFAESGIAYAEPTLVLFRGMTASACGNASSEVGPHYCPLDETIYLDETFFDSLQTQLGAGSADVAQAYVIAHEVGHHVQNELGILDRGMEEARVDPGSANEISVQQELQADCFAGIWAYSIRDENVLAEGEITEALDAAAAVGDDRIQEKTTGRIEPETWTHGSSASRTAAFTRGYESGDPARCESI